MWERQSDDRAPVTAVIPYRASGRMRVRHPRLEPGYLFDAVGVRDGDTVRALIPATTQPPYPVVETPRRPPQHRSSAQVAGIASWYDPVRGQDTDTDPDGMLMGVAYPALDRTGDCGPACDRATPCAPLPLHERQALLEAEDAAHRLRMVTDLLRSELRAINVLPSLPATGPAPSAADPPTRSSGGSSPRAWAHHDSSRRSSTGCSTRSGGRRAIAPAGSTVPVGVTCPWAPSCSSTPGRLSSGMTT